MSTVIDILANTYGFQEYSERLRHNGSLPPPGDKAFDVFLTLTRYVLPEYTYNLHLNQPSVIAVSSGSKRHASIDSQKQFLLKWRVVQKMATVVQIKDFSLEDCVQPTPARWLLHRQAIDRYLQFRLYFRSNKALKPEIDQFSATNHEHQTTETKLQHKLDTYNQQQQTLKQQQTNFETEEKLLLEKLEPQLARFNISSIGLNSGGISDVNSELQLKITEQQQQQTRLDFDAEEYKLEKQRVDETIDANESRIKQLKEQLRLLQMLKATGTAHTMARTSTLTPEIRKIEQQLAEKPREIEKYKSATAAFTEASAVVGRVQAAWERCQQKWKQKPDVDIDELRRRVQSLLKNVQTAEEMYLSTHKTLTELQASVQRQRETKAELSNENPENGAIVLSRDAKYYSKTEGQRYKDEINQLKSKHDELEAHLKATEKWLLDMEKAETTGKSIDDIMASMIQWMKFYVKVEDQESQNAGDSRDARDARDAHRHANRDEDMEGPVNEAKDNGTPEVRVPSAVHRSPAKPARKVHFEPENEPHMRTHAAERVPFGPHFADSHIAGSHAGSHAESHAESPEESYTGPHAGQVPQVHPQREPYSLEEDSPADSPEEEQSSQSPNRAPNRSAHSPDRSSSRSAHQSTDQPHWSSDQPSTNPNDSLESPEHTPDHTPEVTEHSPLHIPEYIPEYTPKRGQPWRVHIDGPDISSDD